MPFAINCKTHTAGHESGLYFAIAFHFVPPGLSFLVYAARQCAKGCCRFPVAPYAGGAAFFFLFLFFWCSSCGPPSFFSGYRKSQAFPPGFCSLNISQTECKQKASNVKFCKLLTSKKPRFPHRYAGFNLSKIFFSKPRRGSLWPIAATSRRLPQSVPSSCRLYSGGAGLCAGPLSVRF